MVITGHIPPSPTSALLSTVRIEVLFSRGGFLTEAWDYELCSPFWRLYVNRRAGAELELEGKRMSLRAETAYLLPAGLRFRTRLAKGARGVWQDFIHFEVDGFPPALLRGLFPAPVVLPDVPEIAAPLAAWRAGLREEEDLAQRLRALALVHAAFALAWEQATAEGRTAWAAWLEMPPAVAPALRRIEERPGDPPGNAELAMLCGLGTRQFLRRFTGAVGLSPGRYALERRVALAAEALARGEEPVEAIAARLGFADRFHFSKAFRARVGVPPATYRRMHGARGGPR
jgi:AraC-type DNA-binding domain-containing proteins